MDVRGLGWVGTRTPKAAELARFYEDVLGLPRDQAEPEFWAFKLPDGSKAEVFAEETPDKTHFTTCAGPELSSLVSRGLRGNTSAGRTETCTNSCRTDPH